MSAVSWLAEQLQLVLQDIGVWDRQSMIELVYINSNVGQRDNIIVTFYTY
jgi:hypothetical protein